jgi:hypothetical protein
MKSQCWPVDHAGLLQVALSKQLPLQVEQLLSMRSLRASRSTTPSIGSSTWNSLSQAPVRTFRSNLNACMHSGKVAYKMRSRPSSLTEPGMYPPSRGPKHVTDLIACIMGQERLAVPLIYNAIIQQYNAIIAQIKPYSCPDPNP